MRLSLPRTLLWRIGLILIGAQLLILLALGWIGLAAVREFHHGQVREELRRIEPVLASTYRAAAEAGPADLDAMVKEDGARTGLRITLIRPDGAVIADSEADPGEMENHRYGRAEIEDAVTEGQGFATRYSRTLRQGMIYFARRSPWADSSEMIVRVSLPLTRVDSELAQLRGLGLGAGAASVVLTVLVVYLVSRRFSRQVESLADTASRFAGGDLGYRVGQPAARELSRLAGALNRMGEQLSDRVAQLQAQQAEQRAILQSMSNGVIALDHEQRVLNINRAAERLLGVPAERARGRLLQESVRHPRLSELVGRLVAGDAVAPTEIEIDTDAHGRRIIEVRGEALSPPERAERGALLVLDDVTERHRFESLRTDFAANVSHELRTPITNIKGYVETLQDVGWEDGERAGRFLGIVRSNADRLAAIVEDVMALSSLEQPHLRETLELHPISGRWLVQAVAEQFEEAARAKSIEIRAEAGEDLRVSGHPRLLQQALGNLVSNAVRYSPERSVVAVRARAADGEVELQVIDNGPGIEAKHLPRLFERFYRVDKARSRELGGTGLGLAIVKHIAGVHGGRVAVASTVGQGSTFSLFIPAAPGSNGPA